MEQKKLKDLIDIDELKSLQNKFAQATGMGCTSEGLDGKLIKAGYLTEYCIFTRLSEKGAPLCKKCQREDMKTAAEKGEVFISQCHAGLINFTAPITADGEHIGSIMGGQVFDRQPNYDEIKKAAQELDIPEGRYVEAAHEINVMPSRRIEGAAALLEVLANMLSEKATQKLKGEA